jgi:hypothetical protein
MSLRSRWLGAVVALALVIAGCGGSSEPDRPRPTTPKSPPVAAAPERAPVTDAETRVIRGWSDELRHGDVQAAAKYFSVPARVSISESDELNSARQVVDFNDSFPCGARLLRVTRTVDHLVLAEFELTDRPGGACDSVGTRASFAILIDGDDHISRLMMVPMGEEPPPASDVVTA